MSQNVAFRLSFKMGMWQMGKERERERVYVCVCVCVSVRVKEREREGGRKGRGWEGERKRERDGEGGQSERGAAVLGYLAPHQSSLLGSCSLYCVCLDIFLLLSNGTMAILLSA